MMFWRKKPGDGGSDNDKPKIDPAGGQDLASVHDDQPGPTDVADDKPAMPVPQKEPEPEPEAQAQAGWFVRLGSGLSKSTNRLGQGITDIFTKRRLGADSLEELENLLVSADLGPRTAAKVIEAFSARKFDKEASEAEIRTALADILTEMLAPVAKPLDLSRPATGPFTLLVCGVNGAGKTTTIGKLAHQWHRRDGKLVHVAAADTYRAAAVDQLEVWTGRAGVPLYRKETGADPAAVAYEAYGKAAAENADILIIDTAGRLQNKSNLMAELEKIIRVLRKHDAALPHAVLLVLDATTGQNAHSQVQLFREAAGVSGLVVTKLDGSAKGGVVISLAGEFGLPIHFVGVGEGIEDLAGFAAADFAKALLGVGR